VYLEKLNEVSGSVLKVQCYDE